MKNLFVNSDAVKASICAFLDPNVISDGDMRPISGKTRSEWLAVFNTWPVEDCSEPAAFRLAWQAAFQLDGFPHRKEAYIERRYGLSPDQVLLLNFYWRGWDDGSRLDGPRERSDLSLRLLLKPTVPEN